MASSISLPSFAATNANIANDGSADSPRGWAISTNADYTFSTTGTSRVRVTATSANRSVTLPTTGIKAGYCAEVVSSCSGGFTLAIKSSDTSTTETLRGSKGRIRLVALQDTPTAPAHWEVVEIEDAGTWTPVWSSTGANPTLGNGTILGTYRRIGTLVHLHVTLIWGSTTTAGAGLYSFSVPYFAPGATGGYSGTSAFLDSGIQEYVGFTTFGAWTANSLAPRTIAGAGVSGTAPFTFGVNDQINSSLTFYI